MAKLAINPQKKIRVPVLRWPGGCLKAELKRSAVGRM